ncbi:hypothetical protein OSTOST_09182 [Ostertagia ostertagi]
MTLKLWLGVLLGVATLAGIAVTVAVLFAVLKLAVFQRKSPIYVISTANMLCDLIQLLLALFYLVPSIISDNWLLEGGRQSFAVGFLSSMFLFCWYYSSIAQILMAINRVFPGESNIFLEKRHNLRHLTFSCGNIYVMAIPICHTLLQTSTSEMVKAITKWHKIFTFDHEFLYSLIRLMWCDPTILEHIYVNLPLNTFSSAICAICYSYVIFFVWKMNHLYIKGTIGSGSRLKEYRYALQFCAISVFYLAAWVTFRLFPILIGTGGVEYFIVISLSVTVNSSANAFVYITSNQEVKSVLFSTNLSIVHHASNHSRGNAEAIPRFTQFRRQDVQAAS